MTYVKTYLPTLKTYVENLKRDEKDLSRDLRGFAVNSNLKLSVDIYCCNLCGLARIAFCGKIYPS